MAKSGKTRPPRANQPETKLTQRKLDKTLKQEKPPLIPEKYQDFILIGLLVIALFVFFWDAIFSGAFNVSDNISSESFRPFVDQATRDGEFPLWIPYIFSGMPAYASMLLTGLRWWDFSSIVPIYITVYIGKLFSSDASRVLCWYIFYGIGMYYLMRSKKMSRFVSFFTMMGAVFSTGILVWIMIGHNTKPMVFSMFPFIFLLLEKLRVKFSLIYSVLLVFAVHIMIEAGHLQMIFYGISGFAIYLIFEMISRTIKNKQPINVLRSAAMLVVAGAFAFLMSSDRYLSTLEYTDYSTRGTAPITKVKDNNTNENIGHDYEYATMWSFSPEEIITFFVPNYFGFGKLKYDGDLTGGQKVMLPVYWGQKPFEDAAPYMGILILFLGCMGAWIFRKDIFVQFLIVLSVFSLFLSFGSTLPWIYDLFYYYVPSFNKFRAPSMALALMNFAVPVLAGYGLSAILKWRVEAAKEQIKIVRNWLIASAAFLLFGFLFSAIFKTAYLDAVSASHNGSQFQPQVVELIYDLMASDWYLTGAIVFTGFIFIYLFVKGKLNNMAFYAIIIFLLMFDLWRVGARRMEVSEETYFKKDDVTQFLQNDKDIFRIADFTTPSPNMSAYYFLQSVNGYHAAKLRIYQDLLDVADQGSTSQVTNPFLWDLMNVKYLIMDREIQGFPMAYKSQESNKIVYYNTENLPRVFFVDSIKTAKPLEILASLKNGTFNPRQIAYLEKNYGFKIEPPSVGSTAKISEYKNHYIKIQAKATGNNLLFISEIFYPPAWKAFLDGKEIDILKTNFAFRSVVVPKGNHTIEMRFSSNKFESGKTISLILNILLLFSFGLGLYLAFRKKTSQTEE